jgi:hypothetical protein
VAAGRSVYFFEGDKPGSLLKKVTTPYEVASVALNGAARKFVTGHRNDTWVRVWDFDKEVETGMSILFFLEENRANNCMKRSAKATTALCGIAPSHRMGSSTRQRVKMEISSCGSSRVDRMGCGLERIIRQNMSEIRVYNEGASFSGGPRTRQLRVSGSASTKRAAIGWKLSISDDHMFEVTVISQSLHRSRSVSTG